MAVDIVDTPFRVDLVGYRGQVAGAAYGPTGKKLMDRMWAEIKNAGIKSKGINHWAYLPNSEMFTGVELQDPAVNPGCLERLEFSVPRFARMVHIGPYTALPQVWSELKSRLAAANLTATPYGLEIYGHWSADESKLETIILIGLA